MCDVLDVSVNGYRARKQGGQPDRKRLSDVPMLALFLSIHTKLKGAYSSPCMVCELRARGFSDSKDARQPNLQPPQSALQGHDELEAEVAGSGKPGDQKLRADDTEGMSSAKRRQEPAAGHSLN